MLRNSKEIKKFLKAGESVMSLCFFVMPCACTVYSITLTKMLNLIIKQPSNGSIIKWSCDKNKTYEYKYLQGKMLSEKNKTVSFLQFLELS